MEWVDHFNGVDCCVSPVLNIQEAMNNERVTLEAQVAAAEAETNAVKVMPTDVNGVQRR